MMEEEIMCGTNYLDDPGSGCIAQLFVLMLLFIIVAGVIAIARCYS